MNGSIRQEDYQGEHRQTDDGKYRNRTEDCVHCICRSRARTLSHLSAQRPTILLRRFDFQDTSTGSRDQGSQLRGARTTTSQRSGSVHDGGRQKGLISQR